MKADVTKRILSIDILRGLVMIIMALDHTRDFFHETAMTADPLDPATTTTALFFTRWITHFCAPTFVFLSGLSAYLSSLNKSKKESGIFLIKRGAWLVLVELTIVTFAITFNPFFNFIILQVIWAIGWSMIILGLLVQTSYKTIAVIGFVLFFGHNLLDYAKLPATGVVNVLTNILLTSRGAGYSLTNTHTVGALYAILPWTGVMVVGFIIGPIFKKDYPGRERKKQLVVLGLGLVALFIALRLMQGYGDPGVWKPGEHSVFSFLNTSKYPPSLQFCCMTLGPALLLLAFFEDIHPAFTKVAAVYGRVPFFYYILHFYLLHILLVIIFFASGFPVNKILDPQSIIAFRPVVFGYSLGLVYIIWLLVVAILYLPSRWYNRYKLNHKDWWLSYL